MTCSGVYEGPVRRVAGPADFDRITRGEVLLTVTISEAFNILLPLPGAIVTDAGGSYLIGPMVAGEYGIPGVVGTRDGTERIPDGSPMRVDGAAGSVTILDCRSRVISSSAAATCLEFLSMPLVRDHMSRQVLSVEPGEPITAVAQHMVDRNLGAVVVLEGKRLVGIMTERDLMRAIARGLHDDALVSEYMTRDPETIVPEDTTEQAAVLMIHGGFRHLPVVENDVVVGMLSIRDLMRIVLEDSAPRGV